MHREIGRTRWVKIAILSSMFFFLIGCEFKSSETPTQSTFLDADIDIDGHENSLDLVVYLSTASSSNDISLPVILSGSDRLLLSIAGSDYSLRKRRNDNRYSVLLNPIPVDEAKLLYSRQSGDEIIESELDYRFSISDLSANMVDEENIKISWSIKSSNNSTEPSALSDTFYFSSKPIACRNNDGQEIEIDSDARIDFLVLDSDEFSIENVELRSNEISDPHGYLFDNNEYSACDFELMIVSSWRNQWDGKSVPTEEGGPVWIWPSTIFNNEQQSLNSRDIFSIKVSSNRNIVEIKF